MGRYTQGVKLIRLSEDEQVGSVAKVPPNDEEDEADVEDMDDTTTLDEPIQTEPGEE
jgi:DNA gyrase subunit A